MDDFFIGKSLNSQVFMVFNCFSGHFLASPASPASPALLTLTKMKVDPLIQKSYEKYYFTSQISY